MMSAGLEVATTPMTFGVSGKEGHLKQVSDFYYLHPEAEPMEYPHYNTVFLHIIYGIILNFITQYTYGVPSGKITYQRITNIFFYP